MKLAPKPDETDMTEESVDLSRQINLEVDSDDAQELLDSQSQELIEMQNQAQDIEELEFKDPFQTEDRMTVGDLTVDLNLIEKGFQSLGNTDLHSMRISWEREKII
ncbi:hypothetical protein TNCV_3815691 [Trichonephila clavipes]|nr:hypothetical protein TNCV_3815691 [Trichonephila clavipes]